MADSVNYSDSVANDGSSAPQITVESEPDEGPTQDSSRQEDKTTDQTESLKFKCASASPVGETSGTSSVKTQVSFGSKMSGLKPATPFGALPSSFLRPPQLASPEKFGSSQSIGENSTNKSPFPLKPARLGNPFAKAGDNSETCEGPSEASTSVKAGPSSQLKFVPLGTPPPSQPRANPAPTPQVATTSAVTSGFVFGQNLHEKVTEVTSTDTPAEKRDSSEIVNNGASCSNLMVASNGSTENLFTSVLKKEQVDRSNDSGGESSGERPSKSLSEAAREYEEARAVKRKYEEVAVVTGEEDEVNVLQINCKLFAFDKVKSSWVERGRGNLRLNDKDIGSGQKQSRVIMRATGSFRVVLNTKLWPGMVVEKVSSKSVRLTAMDAISGEILVFLIMASPKEADFLYNYMESRVSALKATCAETASTYPDASRSSNSGSIINSCSEPGESGSKKLNLDPNVGSAKTSCATSSQPRNKAQDSGGNDSSKIVESNSDDDSALS